MALADSIECFEFKTDTKIERTSFVIKWSINKEVIDKLFQERKGLRVISVDKPAFYNSKWYLHLRHNPGTDPNYLGLLLDYEASLDREKIWVYATATLKANNNAPSQDCVVKFGQWFNNFKIGRGWNKWISKEEVYKDIYWHQESLNFEVEVIAKAVGNESTTSPKPTPRTLLIPESQDCIEERYTKLLETGAFSDVTFCIGDKKFQLHRCILSVACEYFNVMFSSSFKESTEPEIKITDVDHDVFEIIVKYIYTNQFPTDLEAKTKAVLIAAHKYQLQAVVEKCEMQLCNDINLSNCVDLLVVADLFNLKTLKDEIIQFVKKNLVEVLGCDAWKELKESHAKLACDTMEAAIK